MTIPLDTNTSVKTTEKLSKYKDLEIKSRLRECGGSKQQQFRWLWEPLVLSRRTWKTTPTKSLPPGPGAEVDRAADAMEIQRLQAMGVLEVLETKDYGLDSLTTRMVYDWRIKEWRNPQSGETKKRWMRKTCCP